MWRSWSVVRRAFVLEDSVRCVAVTVRCQLQVSDADFLCPCPWSLLVLLYVLETWISEVNYYLVLSSSFGLVPCTPTGEMVCFSRHVTTGNQDCCQGFRFKIDQAELVVKSIEHSRMFPAPSSWPLLVYVPPSHSFFTTPFIIPVTS